MRTTLRSLATMAILCWTIAATSFAGGPLRTVNGQPVKYHTTQPIVYHVDKGSMGSFSNAIARNLAVAGFQVWEDVGTANIVFKLDSLSVDVNGGNYLTYYGNNSDGLNPVIFDSDGMIIDGILGEGSSSGIIGFAGSSYFQSGPNAGFFAEGNAVMNGTMANNPFTEAQFLSTFVHEFGHFIGLDHSQVNAIFAKNGNTADDAYLPTMYPTSSDDDTELGTLNADDIAAVSRLYPVASFAASTGTISGTVTRQGGAAVRGAVVVAIKVDDSLSTQISTVTDYLEQGNGSYVISGLPPGDYWIRLEPVRSSFTSGSSIGPYASTSSDLSFIDPVLREYYNGASESWDSAVDTVTSRVSVSATAGGTVTADMVANVDASPTTTSVLQNFGTPSFVFRLPSEFGDLKYAVRFTPGVTGPLQKVSFLVNGGANAIKGTGTLRVGVFSHKAGSLGGIPDQLQGSYVTKPFTAITPATYNDVDLSSLNLTAQANVNFHVTFDIVGGAGDTVQFITDDATTETNRSSSYYNDGTGLGWHNFQEETNYQTGYNLVVRAYLVTTGVEGEREVELLPDGFTIQQNYPNPFNPTTTIPFTLSQQGRVTLEVVDLLGRVVARLLEDEEYSAGTHQVTFDAKGLASGVYIARMLSAGDRHMVRMLLLR